MRVSNAVKTALIASGCVLLGHHAFGQSLDLRVPLDGQSVYKAYCAACHGADGKGHGPAAPALKRKPIDLTAIAKHNQGIFPRMTLEDVIIRGDKWKAHGSKEMPTWGPVFLAVDGNDTIAYAHVHNLLSYLELIQVK